jgi:hypothetical protein
MNLVSIRIITDDIARLVEFYERSPAYRRAGATRTLLR